MKSDHATEATYVAVVERKRNNQKIRSYIQTARYHHAIIIVKDHYVPLF